MDEAGAVVSYSDYYPFGLEMGGRTSTGDITRENFTGHELDDETGELYAGARYYDPLIGRWPVVDPMSDDYPGLSPYNYVLNNPLMLVDPDGRMPCDPPESCPNIGDFVRETFRPIENAYYNLASKLGFERVETSPPSVHKGWDGVRVLAQAVGIGATAVAATASGASVVVGGSAALAGTAATAATVSTAAAYTETGAATLDYFSGGPSTREDIALGLVSSLAISGMTTEGMLRSFTRTADKVLVPTGLDAALDMSLLTTRTTVRNFARGTGAAVGGTAAAFAPKIYTTVNDAYLHHVPVPNLPRR